MLPSLRAVCFAVCLTALYAGCTAAPEQPSPVAPLDGERAVGTFQTPWGVIELDYQWRNGQMVHDGDMVLDPSLQVSPQPGQVQQPLLSATGNKWEMNAAGRVRIPYVIVNGGVGSAAYDQTAARIRRAMDYWEAHVRKPDGTALLRFVPHQDETRYARFNVKHNGGVCQVFLSGAGVEGVASDPGCRWQTYVHEVGHLLTFRHEQKRQDRPTWVKYYSERTTEDGEFSPVGGSYVGTDYDTHSIMHYPSCMFASASSCGSGTPNAWVLERKYGTRYIKPWSDRPEGEVLSPSDICGTKKLYGISCTTSGAAFELGTLPTTELLAAAGTLQSVATGSISCVQPAENGLELHGCDAAAPGQQWEMTASQTLRNTATRTCARPDAETVGPLGHEECSSDTIQQWRFGEVELVNGQSGQCVEVPDEDYFAGQTLAQRPCTGAPNQKLDFDRQSQELKAHGWCLSLGGAASVELQECDGSPRQQWDVSGSGIAPTADPAVCLSAAEAGSSLSLAPCNGRIDQRWGLRGQITHSNDDYCLSANGAGLALGACDGAAPAQQFTWWPKPTEGAGQHVGGFDRPAEQSEGVNAGCSATAGVAGSWLALLVLAALRRRNNPRAN